METIQVDFTSFTFREAMSKPTGSGTTELFQNDLEPVSEANTSSAHLTDLEHHSDVCEWTVSGYIHISYRHFCNVHNFPIFFFSLSLPLP